MNQFLASALVYKDPSGRLSLTDRGAELWRELYRFQKYAGKASADMSDIDIENVSSYV